MLENMIDVVTACCTLHNICEVHNEAFNEDWLQDAEEPVVDRSPTSEGENNTDSSSFRTCLMQHFSHQRNN